VHAVDVGVTSANAMKYRLVERIAAFEVMTGHKLLTARGGTESITLEPDGHAWKYAKKH
jgi:hypothetical protein